MKEADETYFASFKFRYQETEPRSTYDVSRESFHSTEKAKKRGRFVMIPKELGEAAKREIRSAAQSNSPRVPENLSLPKYPRVDLNFEHGPA